VFLLTLDGKSPAWAVENSSFVTLEMGAVAFHDAKPYTKESLCQILLFQGNQHEYAIGNIRLAKCNKRRGMKHSLTQAQAQKQARQAGEGRQPNRSLDQARERGSMSAMFSLEPIRIGVVANEPMRLEGLTSIFENHAKPGETPLLPVVGTLEEHLENTAIEYVLIDWSSSSKKLGVLEGIRRKRPNLRMVVIGPDSNEQVMMDTIIAGARAYLDTGAGPRLVREALDVVISGSIWAPRKLLSKLIDRLLSGEDASVTSPRPHLTAREEQVLQLLLLARSNREIAEELGIEERTVKAHVGKLMRKIGAENRIELSMRAIHGSYKQAPTPIHVAEAVIA
jgi:DNA-binding NarL/FixJ family response regulator